MYTTSTEWNQGTAYEGSKRDGNHRGDQEQVWANYESSCSRIAPSRHLRLKEEDTFSTQNLSNEEATADSEVVDIKPKTVEKLHSAKPNADKCTVLNEQKQVHKSRQVFTYSSTNPEGFPRHQKRRTSGTEIFEETGGTTGDREVLNLENSTNLRPQDGLSVISEPSSFARLLISMPVNGYEKAKKSRPPLTTSSSSNNCFPAGRRQSKLLYEVSSGSILECSSRNAQNSLKKPQSSKQVPPQRLIQRLTNARNPKVYNLDELSDDSALPVEAVGRNDRPPMGTARKQQQSTLRPNDEITKHFAASGGNNTRGQLAPRKMMGYAKFGPTFKLSEECFEGSHTSVVEPPEQRAPTPPPDLKSSTVIHVEETPTAFRTRQAPVERASYFVHDLNPDFVESHSLTEMISSCNSSTDSVNRNDRSPGLPKRKTAVTSVSALWKRQQVTFQNTMKNVGRISKITLSRAFVPRTHPEETDSVSQVVQNEGGRLTGSEEMNEDSYVDIKRTELMNDFMIKAHHYMRLRTYRLGDAERYYARYCDLTDKSTQCVQIDHKLTSAVDVVEYVTSNAVHFGGGVLESPQKNQKYAIEPDHFHKCCESQLGTVFRTMHFDQSASSFNDDRKGPTMQRTYHVDCSPSLIDKRNSPDFPQDFYAILNDRRVRLKYDKGVLSIYKEPCRARTARTVWSHLAGKAADLLISIVHKNTPESPNYNRHQYERKVHC